MKAVKIDRNGKPTRRIRLGVCIYCQNAFRLQRGDAQQCDFCAGPQFKSQMNHWLVDEQ